MTALTAIADLGRTTRVLGRLAPEVARAPLSAAGRSSMLQTVAEEIDELAAARSALASLGTADASRAVALLDDGIAHAKAFHAGAEAAAPTRGAHVPAWVPNEVPISQRIDVRTLSGELTAAHDAVDGARAIVATMPEVRPLGVTLADDAARAVQHSATPAPEIAAADNSWVRFDPTLTQRLRRLVGRLFVDRVMPVKVHGAQNVPREGAVLLAPNHSSSLDQHWWMLHGHDRTVRTMTRDAPTMPVLKLSGSFPVKRGNGQSGEALAIARRMLANGDAVAVYPEGRLVLHDALGTPHTGAARLALETGTPVVPVAAYGNKPSLTRGHLFERPKVTIVYGEPIRFDGIAPTRENAKAATERIWAGVEQAYEQARALHAAG